VEGNQTAIYVSVWRPLLYAVSWQCHNGVAHFCRCSVVLSRLDMASCNIATGPVILLVPSNFSLT